MPEYLAPGVYVEEVDTGPKPIEGVSTSTSGMVGITERGPLGVPTLVTGVAEFRRAFGGLLDRRVFTGDTWYLPHAVEGFFTNGGKRLYVVRVLPATADSAELLLFDRGLTGGASTRLAAPAMPGHTAVVLESAAGVANDDWLRLDDQGSTEYVRASVPAVPPLPNRGLRALRAPLHANHAAGAATPVQVVTLTPTAAPFNLATTLAAAATAGERRVRLVSRTNARPGAVLAIGAAPTREFAVIASLPADPGDLNLTLRHGLAFDHANAEAVVIMQETAGAAGPTPLDQDATAGTAIVLLEDAGAAGADFDPGDVVRFGPPPPALPTLPAADLEYHDVADLRAIGNRIPVAFTLRGPSYGDHRISEQVRAVTLTDEGGFADLHLAATARAGQRTLPLVSRGSLIAGDVIRIGTAPQREYLTVDAVPTDTLDQSVTVRQPLAFDHAAPDAIVRQTPAPGNPSSLVQDVRAGQSLILLSDLAGYAPGTTLEIGPATSPQVEYQTLGNLVDLGVVAVRGQSGLATAGGVVERHPYGIAVREHGDLLRVQAIDPGQWGNELRIRLEDDRPILETRAAPNFNVASQTLQLASVVGIEVGTVLGVQLGGTWTDRKVTMVGPGKQVTLDAPHGAPVLPPTAANPDLNLVRTREFQVTVDVVQVNPLTGQERPVDGETIRQLSMDPRHSRYVTTVIGPLFRTAATTPRRADGRTDGESRFIRVEDALASTATGLLDLAARNTAESTIRRGPDLVTERRPDGRSATVPRWLQNGDDDIGAVTDATYSGTDDVDPRNRTGLFALKNVEEVSIVAIPGRTSQTIQEALVNHCELMRYRFAVLDSRKRGTQSDITLAEVQEQRGFYDTKYAALYYPWLRIVDPFPDNRRFPGLVSIAPSGHVMGVYARSDIERGVHKAPANEVVRGIRDLELKLQKEEQDILNPRNINVLRNFRDNNRGLRVWGARTLSSDADWKYVNVRRLFIFIEHSIDKGTQWVVFEPNSYPLWERVKRVVSSFLTVVWREGALMGRTAEEAFYVKCDRTTMAQADIDNGRLIVEVGIAPVKPAEFVIFRIGQWTGGSELDEG